LRYVIYGAGGVGSIIGAKLHMAGFGVVLIARGEHLAAIQRDGLQFKHPNPDTTEQLQISAVGHPGEIEFRPDDVVLMTMKSQDTAVALDELRYAAGDQIAVVCAQNGVENERQALRRFANVYGMLVILPANFRDPGVVDTTSWPVSGLLDLGRYPRGTDARAEAIAADLTTASFLSSPDPDIMRVKYTKLRENMINALHALLPPDADSGDLLQLLRDETTACFEAAGIEFAETKEMMARASGMSASVGGVGQGNWRGSSTWQGIMRGAGSTETDYLNGEVVLLGRLHGIPTPANEVMALYVDRMVREKLSPGSVDADELRREITRRGETAPGSK
jgi:2-dehydropantoate 2-reductase